MTAAAADGPLVFARFAYPPNALGYCGPDDPAALLGHLRAGAVDGDLAALARQFDGAWPYLSLIAALNGRRDPLDADVVRAYWIGSRLLERVPGTVLAAQLDERFARRAGRYRDELAALALAGGRAHHNFHVFAVYPWVGLLRAGHVAEPLRVLDGCRVAWGRVRALGRAGVDVRYRPLEWSGSALRLGPPADGIAEPADGGLRIAPGDIVALHWNRVCAVLSGPQLRALRHYTGGQLHLANTALDRPAADRLLA